MSLPALISHDLSLGSEWIVGADEVGRGCLAGPIVAAAVRWSPAAVRSGELERLRSLGDSKKLTPAKRAKLLPVISELTRSVSIAQLSHRSIDRLGIEWCNNEALRRVLRAAAPPAGSASFLVDGLGRAQEPHVEAIVKGESHSAAIAMASIVAKEYRDRLMSAAGELWPQYGFATNAGYGTPAHREVISESGPSPWHRSSFKLH